MRCYDFINHHSCYCMMPRKFFLYPGVKILSRIRIKDYMAFLNWLQNLWWKTRLEWFTVNRCFLTNVNEFSPSILNVTEERKERRIFWQKLFLFKFSTLTGWSTIAEILTAGFLSICKKQDLDQNKNRHPTYSLMHIDR